MSERIKKEFAPGDADAANKFLNEMGGFEPMKPNTKAKREEERAPAAPWGTMLDLADLALRDPEPPQFILPAVPVGAVTAIFGHGGAGKSAIALHMAVCIALGIPFCGLQTQRRRVLFLSCEDRANVLHWRLHHICRYLRVDLAELVDHLALLDLVGTDAVLYAHGRDGPTFRAPMGALIERISERHTDVLFVDGTTHTFGGQENDRGHVTGYVNALAGLIDPERGAVIVIGHVAKAEARNGGENSEGYSGSTAWNNAMRARWYLRPESSSDGDDGERRTGRLILEAQKGNYGSVGTRAIFEWNSEAHLFVGTLDVQSTGGMVDSLRERAEREAIMAALHAVILTGVSVPCATMGRRTAYNVLSASPAFPATLAGGSKRATRRFWRRIEELRQSGEISEGVHRGGNRHSTAVFVPTAPNAAPALNADSTQERES